MENNIEKLCEQIEALDIPDRNDILYEENSNGANYDMCDHYSLCEASDLKLLAAELRKTKAALAAAEEWEAAVFAKAYRRGYWEGCSATAFPSEVENAYERWVKNGKPTHLETDHAVKAQAEIARLKGE